MQHLVSTESIFEVLMLICFGCSWPVAVVKTYQTKNVKGKSILFLWLILLGYLFGITHKILNRFDYVIGLYIANALLVFADMYMYYLYKDKT